MAASQTATSLTQHLIPTEATSDDERQSSLFHPANEQQHIGLLPALNPIPTQSFDTTLAPSLIALETSEIFSQSNDPPSSHGSRPVSILKKSSRSVASTSPPMSPASESSEMALLLLALPSDAWHGIASFLTAKEWGSVSLVSRGAHRACRGVFRRVRMHGFRCAVEVMSAWARGEHVDARELAALYIKNGVPIYAPCLGHSFHTLMWRMSREAREMETVTGSTSANTSNNTSSPTTEESQPVEGNKPKLDRFYSERYEARDRGGYFISSLTYLQEKSLFWRYKLDDDPSNTGRRSLYSGFAAGGGTRPLLPWLLPQPQTAGSVPGSLLPGTPQRRQMLFRERGTATTLKNAVNVVIHQHLANQHSAGVSLISDEDMSGIAEPISLSADFFHPTHGVAKAAHSLKSPPTDTPWENSGFIGPLPAPENQNATQAQPQSLPPSTMTIPPHLESITSEVSVSHYIGTSSLSASIRSRFDHFQQKLTSCFDDNDSHAFNECLLDFWDEFLPRTAGIHFFDKHTPVPRMSRLDSFLSEPCPKAIGIVQCEIERIRSTGSKGKSVKGRLFPTYEYRLFIRDRRPSEGIDCQRKDTILMTAKNRGKNHHNAGQKSASPAPTKRGVNNYYLYKADHEKRSSGHASSPKEMGRLQSNFIGTEFQIFRPAQPRSAQPQTPKERKSSTPLSDSEAETDIDVASPTKKKTSPSTLPTPVTETETDDSASAPKKQKRKSRRKKTAIPFPSLTSRTNRRAIANEVEKNSNEAPTDRPSPTTIQEEEDGAITYTANLLGNRPRVMDVCVPKINEDGSECEWRKYIRLNPGGSEGNRMLNRFKQLQERLNQQEQGAPAAGAGAVPGVPVEAEVEVPAQREEAVVEGEGGITGANATPEDFGLLALQNRPPWWNIELGAFVLNFGGRVSVASVKNFQLCDRNDQDYIMLQFGRIQGRHSFTMDFQYPLTAVQAFAIAISSLQSKISLG